VLTKYDKPRKGVKQPITPGKARGISEDKTPNSEGVQPKSGKPFEFRMLLYYLKPGRVELELKKQPHKILWRAAGLSKRLIIPIPNKSEVDCSQLKKIRCRRRVISVK